MSDSESAFECSCCGMRCIISTSDSPPKFECPQCVMEGCDCEGEWKDYTGFLAASPPPSEDCPNPNGCGYCREFGCPRGGNTYPPTMPPSSEADAALVAEAEKRIDGLLYSALWEQRMYAVPTEDGSPRPEPPTPNTHAKELAATIVALAARLQAAPPARKP